MCEQSATRHHHDSVAADAKPLSVGHQGMDEIASLAETYLVPVDLAVIRSTAVGCPNVKN
jgi:hypothetical protein